MTGCDAEARCFFCGCFGFLHESLPNTHFLIADVQMVFVKNNFSNKKIIESPSKLARPAHALLLLTIFIYIFSSSCYPNDALTGRSKKFLQVD